MQYSMAVGLLGEGLPPELMEAFCGSGCAGTGADKAYKANMFKKTY
jgi:hypothetical protein